MSHCRVGRGSEMKTDPLLRFRKKYLVNESGCWMWRGDLSDSGYGMFWGPDRRYVIAHRWAYAHFIGQIPAEHQIDHLCRERRCVNPDHLEAVSAQENVRRQRARVTHCPQGHAYAGENLVQPKRGGRACRTCMRAWWRQHDAKRRAVSP